MIVLVFFWFVIGVVCHTLIEHNTGEKRLNAVWISGLLGCLELPELVRSYMPDPPLRRTLVVGKKPICDKCKNEMEIYGAIIIAPPDAENKATQTHLCCECYGRYLKWTTRKLTTPSKSTTAPIS